MTCSETRPNRLGWHGTVASRASERKCITSVRQMARIIFHFNHFTRYKVSHTFSFFGLLLDFLLFAIRKLTEPLEATRSMSSRPHCFLSSDPLSPSLPVSSRTQARSAIQLPPLGLRGRRSTDYVIGSGVQWHPADLEIIPTVFR